MSFRYLEPAPLEQQILEALERISAGETAASASSSQVSFREELGRAETDGTVTPGGAQNEAAAADLAEGIASMANSPGGGAIVVGIADDGELIGTQIDRDWLQERIWELTGRKLAADVRPAELDGCRVLVLTAHEAAEMVRCGGKLLHRVGTRDVEMDATTWHRFRLHRGGSDWSALPSIHTFEDVSAAALDVARRHLSSQDDAASTDLAATHDLDLLRRLGLTDSLGRLTNAGSLLFVGTPEPGIDYIRRDTQGGDSRFRVRDQNPLVMQILAADAAAAAANETHHIDLGFVHRQVESVPTRALREAIVNGVTHRDWLSPHPTVVEHVSDTVTVTSPGGFIGGVDPSNIITHPARPRYRTLASAMAKLRLAEQQGVGVARMVGDMLSLGRPGPEITELAGPSVRVVLMGGPPDNALVELLSRIEPHEVAISVDTALLFDHLCRIGWADRFTASATLQRNEAETASILERLADAVIVSELIRPPGNADRDDGADPNTKPAQAHPTLRIGPSVIERIAGTPASQPAACMLSARAKQLLLRRIRKYTTPEGQLDLALSYATSRGRISSTEAASLLSISRPTAVARLRTLADNGDLVSSNDDGGGRGHHYLPADASRSQY